MAEPKINKLQVQWMPTNKVVPYERNNKIHSEKDVDEMAKSITEFGWTQPVVVDAELIILAGHRRHLAAVKLGLEKVPVIVLSGLSDEKKRQYRLVDNYVTANPEWHLSNVALELTALETQGLDLAEFQLIELTSLFRPGFQPNTNPDTGGAEAVDQKDVDAARQQLKDQFNKQPAVRQVTCPECGAEFEVDRPRGF